ncbi:MAG: hypothetical protein PHQ36_05830 [Anaerolineales bacterium]|nr:hypothetical protein [Anaerolineales bacterium]
MALDIREGDILVIGGREYPIRFCGDYSFAPGSTSSMRRMCSTTASTKRSPAVVGGVRGDPEVKLTGIKCAPLDPVSQRESLALRNVTQAPYELLKTIMDGGDMFYTLFVENIRKA